MLKYTTYEPSAIHFFDANLSVIYEPRRDQ